MQAAPGPSAPPASSPREHTRVPGRAARRLEEMLDGEARSPEDLFFVVI